MVSGGKGKEEGTSTKVNAHTVAYPDPKHVSWCSSMVADTGVFPPLEKGTWGFRVVGLRFTVHGVGFRVWGVGFGD